MNKYNDKDQYVIDASGCEWLKDGYHKVAQGYEIKSELRKLKKSGFDKIDVKLNMNVGYINILKHWSDKGSDWAKDMLVVRGIG